MPQPIKEQILEFLEIYYPTQWSLSQIISELKGAKKPSPALVISILNELVDEGQVNFNYNTEQWSASA